MQHVEATRSTHDIQIGQKIRKAFWATIVFVVLSYPATYRLVATIFSTVFTINEGTMIYADGSPTPKAFITHMLMFFFVILLFIV